MFTTRNLNFPVTGGRILLTGEGCPAQTGHNDFDQRKGSAPAFFFITTGHEPTEILVANGSHKGVDYS